jgi:hypothetical protein
MKSIPLFVEIADACDHSGVQLHEDFNAGKGPGGSNCDVDRTDAQSLLPGTYGRFWREAAVRTQTASRD